MALVSVLWGIALLSIVTASFLSTGTMSYGLARNALEISQTDALAEAMLNRAVLGLLDPRLDKRWRTDGIAQSFDFDGAHARISIQDELGRIDLNHADGALLVSLFRSVGLDQQAASSLVDKVLDWRDAGDLKRLNGAKADDYRLAGLSYRPRKSAFQSIDELKLVMGMTAELFERVEPAITVYSGRPFVDPNVAPREVLLALPTMDDDKVTSLLAARADQTAGQSSNAMTLMQPLTGRAFTVQAEITRAGRVLLHETVIRLTGNPAQPYWVLSWKGRKVRAEPQFASGQS